MQFNAASLSAADSFSFFTNRSRLDDTVLRPRATAASSTSIIVTGSPTTAHACAMPLPMVPAPMTPIFCIDVIWNVPQYPSCSRRPVSSHDVHAAVDVLRCTGQPACVGRGKKCAGGADVHDVDQLANRRALCGLGQEQIEVLERGRSTRPERPR